MTEKFSPTPSEIKAIFEKIAPVYDDLNNWLSFGQHRIWKMMAVKWSQPHKGDIALDICCGSGDLALMLGNKVGDRGTVIGLDFAKEQLEIASLKKNRYNANLPITWMEGDALNLPFENNYFDCATMGYGLRNVTNIPLSLKELYRVLKPNSKAAILDFHRPEANYMKAFQDWYLENIVIPTANRFNMREEYAYLIPSLAKFPTGAEQIKLAYNTGFSKATYYPLNGGIMGVLVITK